MNKDKMNLEEAKSYLETVIKVNNSVIKEARKNGDINTIELTADLDNQSIAIETVLQALETYKRLAEANLKDSKEFQDNMCEHRCILESELKEIKESSIPRRKIEDKILQEWKKCPKNSINDFAITERNNKIQILQELLENK